MARINGNQTFNPLGQSEIQNVIIERLASAPTFQVSEKGRIYFNTTSGAYYYNNGTVYIALATGGDASAVLNEVNAIETALGAAIKTDGTFDALAFSGFTNVVSPTDMTNVLSQLDAAISGKDAFSELVDVDVTAMANRDVVVYDTATSKWVNKQPGSDAGIQGYDAALASLAGITYSADQMVYTTAADTFATSTITSLGRSLLDDVNTSDMRTTLGLVIGTDVQAWDADLDTIAGFTHTAGNLIYDDGTVWAVAGPGSTSGVQAYNADLVQFASLTPADSEFLVGTGGSEGTRWALESGSTVRASLGLGDIATHNDAEYVRVDGTHAFTANQPMGGFQLTNLGAPTADTNAATKLYVDGLITGLSWKNPAVVATTGNVDLTTGGLLTVDGVTLVAGNRVLVASQTLPAENGIYLAAAGAWVRSLDANANTELGSAAIWVESGTTYADTGWTCTNEEGFVLNTDPVTFVQFNGAAGVTAGVGLSKTGNTLNINLGAGIAQLPTDEVSVDIYEANGSLILTTDGSTHSTDTAAKLHLLLDLVGHGTLTQTVAGLRIADDGVDEYNISTTALGNGLQGGSGALVSAKVDNASIGFNGSFALAVKDGGITNAKLANNKIVISDSTNGFDSSLGDTLTFTSSTAALTVDASVADTLDFTIAPASDTVVGVASFATANFNVDGGGNVTLDTSLDSLNDVTIASVANKQAVVYSSANSRFENKSIYHLYTSGSASTSHSINHGLNQQYCVVTVVDASDDNVVIPQSIVFVDANNLTVTFNTAINTKVVIMGV